MSFLFSFLGGLKSENRFFGLTHAAVKFYLHFLVSAVSVAVGNPVIEKRICNKLCDDGFFYSFQRGRFVSVFQRTMHLSNMYERLGAWMQLSILTFSVTNRGT